MNALTELHGGAQLLDVDARNRVPPVNQRRRRRSNISQRSQLGDGFALTGHGHFRRAIGRSYGEGISIGARWACRPASRMSMPRSSSAAPS